MPLVHLATGQAKAVLIYRPGAKGRSIMGNNVKIWLLLPILTCYRLFIPIIDLPENGAPAPGWGTVFGEVYNRYKQALTRNNG